MAALTPAERRLRSEVEEIASLVELDIWNIEDHEPGPSRAYHLEFMKDKLARSEVIIRYTLIDEFLTDIICDYYFHRRDKKNSYRSLWRTKHFKIFVHFLMDETFLLKKLATVEAITTVPVEVSKAIKRINDVRNAIAHSFYPQNRRRYHDHKKVIYNGVHPSSRRYRKVSGRLRDSARVSCEKGLRVTPLSSERPAPSGRRHSLKKLLRGHDRAAVFVIDRIFVAEAIAHQFVPASRRKRLQRADAVAPITAGSHKMGELVHEVEVLGEFAVNQRIGLDRHRSGGPVLLRKRLRRCW